MSSAYRRMREWLEAGVFLERWRQGLEAYDELEGIDWSYLSMDGAMSKAPLAGTKKRARILPIKGPGQPRLCLSPRLRFSAFSRIGFFFRIYWLYKEPILENAEERRRGEKRSGFGVDHPLQSLLQGPSPEVQPLIAAPMMASVTAMCGWSPPSCSPQNARPLMPASPGR